MEDCCVVCAEPLEWIGYGSCGHRDVCSVCIARLRFVLNDKRCCICKQECNTVFVTKALGDFTNLIGDFSTLPERKDFWFENNIQAYFDDVEHHKMLQAMCRPSCRICEQGECDSDMSKEFVRKGYVFRNLHLLRKHLQHVHKVQMCDLCLEGRKVFICEQKLFTRGQLEHHLSKGNSEADGDGEERGGFTGHPMCEFCLKRFYGENELYQHMSMDHYTCHICDRLRPGRYDYYRNYDDLEAHFRHEHSLCEHPDCLAKKFVVFVSETELKRHNALNHGGNMSRAQRNAALQIPVSFQFRRPGGQDRAGARNRRSYSNGQAQLLMHGPNIMEQRPRDEAVSLDSDSNAFPHLQNIGTIGVESLRIDDRDEQSRYRAVVSGSGHSSLEESAFPPLPGSGKNARRKAKQRTRGTGFEVVGGESRGGPRIDVSQNLTHETGVANQWLQGLARRPHGGKEVARVLQTYSAIDESKSLEGSGKYRSLVAGPSNGEGPSGFVAHLNDDELRVANKVLIDKIRLGLRGNADSFNAFKDISAQFRKDKIDAVVYIKHVTSFGLEHLIPELARLCPDPDKQKNLLEAYEKGSHGEPLLSSLGPHGELLSTSGEKAFPVVRCTTSSDHIARPGKEPLREDASVPSISDTASSSRLTDRGGTSSDTSAEVFAKDGYRDLKGRKNTGEPYSSPSTLQGIWKVSSRESSMKVLIKPTEPLSPSSSTLSEEDDDDDVWACEICTLKNKQGRSLCDACGLDRVGVKPELRPALIQGQGKRKKKAPKFERTRLDNGQSDVSLHSNQENGVASSPSEAQPVTVGRGAWRNGGGQRLMALAQRESIIESAWKK